MGRVYVQPASLHGYRKTSLMALAAGSLALSGALPAPAAAASRRNATINTESAIQTPQAPRTVLVSIRKQRLRLLDGDREITSSRISSGQPGFDTPTGVFSILEKNVYHESNIYEGAPMPFMQRITWSGIAMHAGVVPGYRASHGCVRLPAGFAPSFFKQTEVGGRVIITQDEVNPVRFQHTALFKPLPENNPPSAQQGASAGEPKVAANDVTADDRAALTSLVNTAAAAAPVTPAQPAQMADKPRSRAEVTRRFAEKMQNLAAALKAAEDKKQSASDKAKAAVRGAQDAEGKLNDVRRPFEDVLRAASSAETTRADAARAYRTFLNQSGQKKAPEAKVASSDRKKKKGRDGGDEAAEQRDNVSPEDREQDLEDRLLDAVVEVANTKKGAAAAELAIADAKAAFAKADSERQQALEEVRTSLIELRQAQTALIDVKAEATRRARPLSIFISLKSQRLYIRQGFEPIFETPIEVDDPGTIGTHVLTALSYDQTGDNFVWQLVTAQQPRVGTEAVEDRKGKKKTQGGETVAVNSPLNVEAARTALDSIKIPPDVQEQISELARPGTSLIISEKDLSRETGKGTEFVILTR